MKKKEIILEELCTIVSPRLGHTIGTDHIHTDECGWHYYIPAKSLQANHPLILNHYRGPLFMVVPINDWKKLEAEEITVREYVDNSVWSFGYFWGGGSMLDGVHWQPFEEKGIHEKEKISRYLTILSCRTYYSSSGYMPTEKICMSCPSELCPFSRCAAKYEGASWDNEIKEVDDRIPLYEAVMKRIQKQFGFKVVACNINKTNTITIFPSSNKDTVMVYLPETLLIDMMYHPGKYNIEETANNLEMEIGVHWHYENEKFVASFTYPVAANDPKETFYDIWKTDCPSWVCNWFDIKDAVENKAEVSTTADEEHDLSFMERMAKFFKNLF